MFRFMLYVPFPSSYCSRGRIDAGKRGMIACLFLVYGYGLDIFDWRLSADSGLVL
jgi:hypothetical protein